MTVAVKTPTPNFGKHYHRARQIARQCGYTGVALAHAALQADPHHPFTERQARAIAKGYAQMRATLNDRAGISPSTTALMVAGETKTTAWRNVTTYTRPRPLADQRTAIVARIASYHARTTMGVPRRTATVPDESVHLFVAKEAMTDLWNATVAAMGAANILDGAYGIRDGAPFVAIDAGAQEDIAAATAAVREALGALRRVVLAVDRVNREMEPKKEDERAADVAAG